MTTKTETTGTAEGEAPNQVGGQRDAPESLAGQDEQVDMRAGSDEVESTDARPDSHVDAGTDASNENAGEDESGDKTGEDGSESPVEDELARAQAETAEFRDRWIRAVAELENTRKRAERDRRDAEAYGGRRLARDLLSVHDNLNRALSSVDDDQREAAHALIEGVELTLKELVAAFSRNGIVRVAPEIGDRFDPKRHEAMFNAPHPEVPAGSIMTVIETGFSIGDRLLRAAQVGVSAGPPPAPNGEDE